MKLTIPLSCIFLLVQLSLVAQNDNIDQFKWLIGSWEGKQGKGVLHETWRLKDANTMLGNSYFIIEKDTVVNEIIRFEKIAGHWCFIAAINGGAPILFHLIQKEPEKWVFENKEHDFPQRVVYTKGKNGMLHAWVEGTSNNKFVKDTFLLEKID